VQSLLQEAEELRDQVTAFQQAELWTTESLLNAAVAVGDSQVIVLETVGCNANRMRVLIDQVRKQNGSAAIMLLAAQGPDKVTLVAGVTRDLVAKGVSAGNWVKEIAPIVGGGGGGKPDMAQAGGKDPGQIVPATQAALSYMKSQLAV
jgi:alanyl-tRNA synthetase